MNCELTSVDLRNILVKSERLRVVEIHISFQPAVGQVAGEVLDAQVRHPVTAARPGDGGGRSVSDADCNKCILCLSEAYMTLPKDSTTKKVKESSERNKRYMLVMGSLNPVIYYI